MRPFARRVVAYVRSVGSNPTLSFECFVSQNGVGSRLSIHISLINLLEGRLIDWTLHDCMATYILGKL